MANLRSRFRQILGCVLTAGMMVGGMNLTVLPVSATEIEAESSEEPLSGNFGASRLTGVSLNVYKYLKYLLEHLPETPMSIACLDKLAPWNRDVKKACSGAME